MTPEQSQAAFDEFMKTAGLEYPSFAEIDRLRARNAQLEAACRLALPVTRENLPKSHDAYQAIKAALATAEREAK